MDTSIVLNQFNFKRINLGCHGFIFKFWSQNPLKSERSTSNWTRKDVHQVSLFPCFLNSIFDTCSTNSFILHIKFRVEMLNIFFLAEGFEFLTLHKNLIPSLSVRVSNQEEV